MSPTDILNNPVTDAVNDIAGRIETLTADQVATLEDSATLDMGDWLTFGDKPSLALAMGLIDPDVAQALHMIHTDFNNGASLAQRIVFLQVMSELLPRLMGR